MNEPKEQTSIKSFSAKKHLLTRVMSGILVLVPFVVTFFILRFVLVVIMSLVSPIVVVLTPSEFPKYAIAALSVLLLIGFLYLIGTIATYSLGNKFLGLMEIAFLKIPLLKTIYGSAKTAVSALSFTQSASFTAVVLIQFPKDGFWSIGFVTGSTMDANGEEYFKLFIPTTPNPTSGFFEIVRKDKVVRTKLTIEQGIQTIVSGGILFPKSIPLATGETISTDDSATGSPDKTNGGDN